MKNIHKFILPVLLFAAVVPAFAQSAVSELNFYKKQSQGDDKKLLETISDNLNVWLEKNNALPSADEALLLKADIELRVRNYPQAAITLLRHKYEFPTSPNLVTQKSLFASVISNSEKKSQSSLSSLSAVKVNAASPVEERLSDFLEASTKMDLKGGYAPMLAEYKSFFSRFPEYENKDKMELMLGDLHRQNKNFQAAVMQYRKVYDIYPSTKYKAASVRMMGDIYAGELKDYTQGLYYYEMVLKNFPDSIERGTTYNHMAIMADNKKDYTLALSSITKAADIYLKEGQAARAYEALRYKSEIQEEKVKDYAGSVDTLNKTAEIFAKDEERFVDTKFKAADIYGRRLKDDYGQINAYEAIVIAYPSNARATEALYEAARLAEGLNNLPKAKDLYQRLIVEHPADGLATKAQRRLNIIEKQLLEPTK